MDSRPSGAESDAPTGSRLIGTLRRAFCLLVLFDFIFTCILWFFYTRYLDLPLSQAFKSQVLQYSFTKSVFDIVVVAFARFLLLELMYALLRITNPWMVAVTTALTTAFVIVKIILYDYEDGTKQHSVFEYLLPIMSLVLVWIETFLLDCKVLPSERADLLTSSLRSGERAPLLPGAHGPRYNSRDVASEGFVTPETSPENSDTETDTKEPLMEGVAIPIQERAHLLERAARLTEESWLCLKESDWRCAHDRPPVRVLWRKSHHRPSGKAWRMELLTPLSAERMFSELWDRVDRQADWNPTVRFSRVVARLNRDTALVHNATVEAGGGLIKSRDFVTLCVRCQRDGVRYTGGVSVETALVPRADGYTRGENHPGCVACLPNGPDACTVVWIVDSDIKGWVPAKVIDQAMCSVLTQIGNGMHMHASRIAQNAPV